MSYYWDVVKDMDDSQKLQLVTMLVESVQPKELYTPEEAYEMTMKDIKAIYDDATV